MPRETQTSKKPRGKGTPTENGRKDETLKRDLKGKESQEKEKEPLRRAKEEPNSPKLDETAPKELENGSNLKWRHPTEGIKLTEVLNSG